MAIDIQLLNEKALAMVETIGKIPASKLTERISRSASEDFIRFRHDLIAARPEFERLVPSLSIGVNYCDLLSYARTAVRLMERETGIVQPETRL